VLALQRALELLALPQDGTPRLLLDIGCGSGLSGEALTGEGHSWVGTDISPAMLDVAREREVRPRMKGGGCSAGEALPPAPCGARVSQVLHVWAAGRAPPPLQLTKRRGVRGLKGVVSCWAGQSTEGGGRPALQGGKGSKAQGGVGQ